MARSKSAENDKDPATGRMLSPGMTCRGPGQCRTRKLAEGQRKNKVHDSARLAREWLEAASVQVRQGDFVDRRLLEKITLLEVVERYVAAKMKDGGDRRGAAEDRVSHIPSITKDPIAKLLLARLGPGEVCGWRARMLEKFAPATVVKRMNLLSTVLRLGRVVI